MTAKNSTEFIEVTEALKLLKKVLERGEKPQIYYSESEFTLLSLQPLTEKSEKMILKAEAPSPLSVGQIYTLQFELEGITYSGKVLLEGPLEDQFSLRYQGRITVLNRRTDFRIRPPDQEHYFIMVTEINGKVVQHKFDFYDMSLGGVKAFWNSSAVGEVFSIGSSLKGFLQCQGQNYQFKGKIKSRNRNHMGIQFVDMEAGLKNQLWNELMNWYRLRKNRYAS